MNANRAAKVATIDEIKSKFEEAKAVVVIDYHGLAVKDMQNLRKQLKPAQIEMQIFKNRLVKRASDALGYTGLAPILTGQSGFVFGYGDDIAPAKLLTQFAKENSNLKLKAGIFEGKVVDSAELAQIAAFPTYEQALGLLGSQLIGALRYVSVGLHLLTKDGTHLTQ